jgi:hypothetical protein
MKFKVFVRMETRHVIKPHAKESIEKQTPPPGYDGIEIVEVKSDGEKREHTFNEARQISERLNFQMARDMAVKSGAKYCVIQDRAYSHNNNSDEGKLTLRPNNFVDMLNMMEAMPNLGALSVVFPGKGKDPKAEHVDTGVCIWRIEALAKMTWDGRYDKPNVFPAVCCETCREFRANGYDIIDYHENVVMLTKL